MKLSWLLAASLATALSPAAARVAHANGAFPDSEGILLPTDHPNQIMLATNFGLISSDDEGKTWSWSCEQPNIADFSSLYQLGPAPLNRLFVLSSHGLIHSDDGSCTWIKATGAVDQVLVTDYFPDPTDPMRVLAIGLPNVVALAPEGVYQSLDGGVTFSPPLYTGPIKGGLTGIESARSDPKIIYLAMYQTPGLHPRLVKSIDGGQTWSDPLDLEPTIGANLFRIIAIDPQDPNRIFLRVTEALSESLAISDDGGITFRKPVTVGIKLTSFLRLPNGTILVGGEDIGAAAEKVNVSFRSTDGGQTFSPLHGPAFRALAVRDGALYAATDNFKDGFALGVSTDEGATFAPLMAYDKVSSVKQCVYQVCGDSCRAQALRELFSMALCPAAPDAGVPAADAGPPLPPVGSACGCVVGGAVGSGAVAVGALLAGALLLRRRRRRIAPRAVSPTLDRPEAAV